jgi:hypothetical protein
MMILYEIERLIHHKKREKRETASPERLEDEPDIRKLTQKVVSLVYWRIAKIFSKRESDDLPRYTLKNLKIKFEKELGKQRTSLYKMSSKELEAAYEYILDNMRKGFIEPSGTPFASPILMMPKSNGSGLRFCVDYRKLNAATQRNQYPHPLIEETL